MSASDKNKAYAVIDELGLAGMSSSSLSELSGGQMQRVFLGRAIIGNPKLLLLDEPGNFVDATFESDFYEKLRDLNKKMAILMVSHDVGTISSHIKSFACVNRSLHYHPSHEITNEDLLAYGCPIQLVTHGDVPHTVLKYHK
jgi:zinc transport system ATP-binding protein